MRFQLSPTIHHCVALIFLLLLPFSHIRAQSEAGEETTAAATDETQVIASDFESTNSEQASDAPAQPSPQVTPTAQRLSEQQQKLLSEADVRPAPVWLTANDKQVLGFWQPELSGTYSGAVLLLHDEGDSPLTPETLLNLQQHLPQMGWATLSIKLPKQVMPSAPDRPEPQRTTAKADEQQEAPTNESENTGDDTNPPKDENQSDETQEVYDDKQNASTVEQSPAVSSSESVPLQKLTTEDVDQQSLTNIQAAIGYLQQQGQYNIVILGKGVGAIRALQFTQQGNASPSATLKKREGNTTATATIDRPIRALVLLDIENHYGTQRQNTLELMTNQNMPTLDVYTHTSPRRQKEAKIRKNYAKKQKVEIYRQKRLTPLSKADRGDIETPLSKTIRGFLDRFAKGEAL